MNFKKITYLIFPKNRFNKSLRILITVNTTMVFVLGMLTPFYAVFIQKIGGDVASAGLSWAIFCVVAGILTLALGNWRLKVKEQELLLSLGYIIRGIVFLSYAFMGSMLQLILTQIIWGIGVAFGTPAFDSVYSSHTNKKQSVAQWGHWEGIASIATGLAAIIGGILIQKFGYLPVFLGMSALSFYLGIYVWRLPRETL
ncbi:MAG: MFS transporter [Candidatus Paceibacterota bacterium]|jgi:predicted MFS family arabinose efflux permease|nr:MFS transporter [Candidatus Paceibacterota bacterium]MDD5621435.1 MFS transporter [Candidatus Paceibacterota bacterium]